MYSAQESSNVVLSLSCFTLTIYDDLDASDKEPSPEFVSLYDSQSSKKTHDLAFRKKSCGYAEMVISGPRLPNLKVKRRGTKGENSFHFFINFFILRLCN